MPFRSQYQDRLNRELEYIELGEEVILKPAKRKLIEDVISEVEKEEERIKAKGRKNKRRPPVPDIAKRYTDEVKAKLITDIINITEDESLGKNKGTIRSLVYSKGGSKDKNSNLNRDEADHMKFTGKKSAYLAIVINGILVLEAIGQADNATYVGKYNGKETLKALRKYTRTEIVKNDIMYPIKHEPSPIKGVYDYESEHIRTLLQAAVDNPQELLEVIDEHKKSGKKGKSNVMFNTIKNNMAQKVAAAKAVAKQIVKDKGLDAKTVIQAGQEVFAEAEKNPKNVETEKTPRRKPVIIKPTKRTKNDGTQPEGR